MKIEKYAFVVKRDKTLFEFTSKGPKGSIRKVIEFDVTDYPGVFNLSFGDKIRDTGEIDDIVVSDNKDTDKVLATIVSAVYAFFTEYPNALIYATGSTLSRTRLYRMGITRFYKEVIEDFNLYGQIGDDFYKFELGKEYSGFMVERKIDNLQTL